MDKYKKYLVQIGWWHTVEGVTLAILAQDILAINKKEGNFLMKRLYPQSIMTQNEFNKEERIRNLINQTKEKELGYQFILNEFKRNKWNINLKQAEFIANELNVNMVRILFEAEDLNILNVDNKTKKALKLQRKNKQDYYD